MNGKTCPIEINGITTDSLRLTIYQSMKDTKTKTLTTRVTEYERKELRLMSKHLKKSLSDITREAINNYKKTIISQGK